MSQVPPQQKQTKPPVYCRTCNAEIKFHKDHRGSQGGWVPLNPDFSVHDCPKKPPQKYQQQASQTSSAAPTPAPTTTPVEVKEQQQEHQPSTNDVVEIKTLLLQVLRRLEHLEQVVVSQK